MFVPLSYYYVAELLIAGGVIAGALTLVFPRRRPGRAGSILIGLIIVLGMSVGLVGHRFTTCCDMPPVPQDFYGYPFQWVKHGPGWSIDGVHFAVDVVAWAGAGVVLALLLRLVRPQPSPA